MTIDSNDIIFSQQRSSNEINACRYGVADNYLKKNVERETAHLHYIMYTLHISTCGSFLKNPHRKIFVTGASYIYSAIIISIQLKLYLFSYNYIYGAILILRSW